MARCSRVIAIKPPVLASLWLNLHLSNVLARSRTRCCDLPCRYSSCIQHCVIAVRIMAVRCARVDREKRTGLDGAL